MIRLLFLLLPLAFLLSCDDKDTITLPGPESVVRYKLNGNLVEIKGSLLNSPAGSSLKEEVRKEGTGSRVYNYLKAFNSTDTFHFFKTDYLGINTYTIRPSDVSGYTAASFSSGAHQLKGSLGTSANTEFTLTVDRRSEGTVDGRFYGTATDARTGALVTLSEGEFKNVWMTQ
jgi:hypothetical protein